MDWKSLTAKFDPLLVKLDPFLDKAKDAGYKALDFTQKQLQNTPLVLKTLEEYNLLHSSKRFILISYDETDPLAREVLLRSPVWSTQAWSDAAELRFVEIASAPDIVRTLSISGPLDMRVWYTGNETFHTTDLDTMKAWWKLRCYDGKEEILVEKSDKKSENPESQIPEEKDSLSGK